MLHRASIVEIAVPYAEPRAPFHKKCAFDVVDYGLGYSCSSLELGCDCLGHIHYFDATLSDSKGALRALGLCPRQHCAASLDCAVDSSELPKLVSELPDPLCLLRGSLCCSHPACLVQRRALSM